MYNKPLCLERHEMLFIISLRDRVKHTYTD